MGIMLDEPPPVNPPSVESIHEAHKAFHAAGDAWSGELAKNFGAEAGNVRYMKAGEGAPGTALNDAYLAFRRTNDAWLALVTASYREPEPTPPPISGGSPEAVAVMADPEFRAWKRGLADRLAWEHDGGDADDYPGPGWDGDGYEPTEDEARLAASFNTGGMAESDVDPLDVEYHTVSGLEWAREMIEIALRSRDMDLA